MNSIPSLFIVCPFCQIENLLKTTYGQDIFLMTAPSAVVKLSDEQRHELKEFFMRHQIKDIYLVNDVGCNFLAEAINDQSEFGLTCEKELRSLKQNVTFDDENSLEDNIELLAEENISKQLLNIMTNEMLKNEMQVLGIKAHGIITNKKLATLKNCDKQNEYHL
jgi:carbonic anhydrase